MSSSIQKSQPILKVSIIFWLSLSGFLMYAILWLWTKQYAPDEGHVFQRLPALKGVYVQEPCTTRKCSRSFLNGEPIQCWSISFFQSRPHACGESLENNGRRVSIEKVLVPVLGEGWVPAISSFTAETRQADIQIRNQWLDKTQLTCVIFALAFWFFLTFMYVGFSIQDFIKQSDR